MGGVAISLASSLPSGLAASGPGYEHVLRAVVIEGLSAKAPYKASSSRLAMSSRPSHSFFVAHHSELVPPRRGRGRCGCHPRCSGPCGGGVGPGAGRPGERRPYGRRPKTFHAKCPSGRSDAATRSNVRLQSAQVGTCSSASERAVNERGTTPLWGSGAAASDTPGAAEVADRTLGGR